MLKFVYTIIVSLFLFSCEHYASNVEITYKSQDRVGYKFSNTQPINAETSTASETPQIKSKPKKIKAVYHDKKKSKLSQNKSNDKKKEYHVVQKGETYYSIARLYNLSPKDLMAWNSYKDGDVLYPTMTVKLNSSSAKSNKNSVISKSYTSKTTKSTKCRDKFILPIKQNNILVKFNAVQKGGVKSDGIIFKIIKKEVIKASSSGEVVYVGDGFSDYGNIAILKHKNNYFSIYGYLEDTHLKKGQFLMQGDSMAQTSLGEGKFYFAIRKGKIPINPSFCKK